MPGPLRGLITAGLAAALLVLGQPTGALAELPAPPPPPPPPSSDGSGWCC